MIWRGNVQKILKRRVNLKNAVTANIDERLTKNIYINEHLTAYYGTLRFMCKKLWEAHLITKFWISGHKVKAVIAKEGPINIITHTDDFRKLFPGQDLSAHFKDLKK